MSRSLHEQAVCVQSQASLQDVLAERVSGAILVVAPSDERLLNILPVGGQQQLPGTEARLSFESSACTDHYIGELPVFSGEYLPYPPSTYDAVILIQPRTAYHQRAGPFLDCVRIAVPGATLLAVTGLQPNAPPAHDAKWWVPHSDAAQVEEIVAVGTEGYRTPTLVSVFRVDQYEQHSQTTVVDDAERIDATAINHQESASTHATA